MTGLDPITRRNQWDYRFTEPTQTGEMTKLEGIVLDESGLPIVGALVELWNTTPSGSYTFSFKSFSRQC